MRRGFTLLELMVASLLMAMLMVILTMIFNQSSIAWSTGTAAVSALGEIRHEITHHHHAADNALETEGTRAGLQVVSVWSKNVGEVLRTGEGEDDSRSKGRALDRNGLNGSDYRIEDPMPNGTLLSLGGGSGSEGGVAYVVGVASNGPDGEAETWDDISTFPEDQL